MNWVVFSYSLPAKGRSSARVAVWRRLGHLGAISTTSGVYVLPARDECVEALQWLAQEARQAGGEALLMRVEKFEGMSDGQLVESFNQARAADYEKLDADGAKLEQSIRKARAKDKSADFVEGLTRLRRRYLDIVRLDYFDSPLAVRAAARLAALDQLLAPAVLAPAAATPTTVAHFANRRWVTRPRPRVDRLSSIWLIRRYIDAQAPVRYALTPEPDEIPFDMGGARFGHQGNHCTFETLCETFGLDDPGLRMMAEIIHEVDLRDGLYEWPAAAGVDTIISGWIAAGFDDATLEQHGIALFEGLYAALAARTPLRKAANRPRRRKPK
jgi:hypothetical protein